MRARWGRTSAIVGLAIAIFSDLRRRAWWSYRRGAQVERPHTTLVSQRPGAQRSYIPRVTSEWRTVAASAIDVDTIAFSDAEATTPVATINVGERPDIVDLPRVIQQEWFNHQQTPVVGTQWLAGQSATEVFLVITFVEPVECTFALRFDLPRTLQALQTVAEGGDLLITWEVRHDLDDPAESGKEGILVRSSRPGQLRAILMASRGASHMN